MEQPRQKSVLFIVENLPVPEDRRVWMEALALRDAGLRVMVISVGKKEQPRREKLEGVEIFRFARPPLTNGYLSYAVEYLHAWFWITYLSWKIYFKQGFAAIHVANPPDFLVPAVWSFKLLGAKIIWDQHDLMPEMFLARFGKSRKHWIYRLLCWLEKMSLKICDAHIMTCKSGHELVKARSDCKKGTCLVRTAPDLVKLNAREADKKTLARIEQELKSRFKYLAAYVGVMGPQDGIDKLIRSIRYIVKEEKKTGIGFILMGEGDFLAEAQKMVQENGLTDNVVFTGWVNLPEMAAYLSAADLGLMPEPKNDYTNNSLHNKVLEYMAMGLPIVAYDLKEARQTAGGSAFFVKDDNEKDFGKAVIELLGNVEQRKEMAAVAQERIKRKEFQWSASEQKLVKIYKELGLIVA